MQKSNRRSTKIVRLLDAKSRHTVREKILDGMDTRDLSDHADNQWGEKNTRGLIIEIDRERKPEFTTTFSFGKRR